ncbi:MAG: NAD-dependent epimerase/dehydratase family protein [Marinilabiliales bacterium]|nr:NAD-dependent epimerase/dehydratase family protein [Marinilabiliales bacterium]
MDSRNIRKINYFSPFIVIVTSLKPTSLLITGCAGFIGSNLCRKLLDSGYTVIGLDNFDPYYAPSIKKRNLQPLLAHPGFIFHETDVTDESSLEQLPLGNLPELVVHLAAKVGVRSSFEHPDSYHHTNLTGTRRVVEWMMRRGISKLVFASSSSVYGDTKNLPFMEDDPLSVPISPYAASKAACEAYNRSMHLEKGLDVINLRFFTVYGPAQRPDLAIHRFLSAMKHGEEIALYGDGHSTRDYTYVEDVVAGIESAIRLLQETKGVCQSINLGSGRPVALNEMIALLGEISGYDPVIRHEDSQQGDLENTFASLEKAGRWLGYQPTTPFREGIQKFVEWFEANPLWEPTETGS